MQKTIQRITSKNILAIIIFLGLSLACALQAAPAILANPTQAPTPTATVVDVEVEPEPTPKLRTYTVTAYRLWVRDMDMERVGYLRHGEPVECVPTDSGWCMMEGGWRVWEGCLEPNPNELGCEAR
jgi:hypothetical protein